MKNTTFAVPVKTVSVTTLGGFGMETERIVLTDEVNRSQKLWNVLAYLILHRDRAVAQSEFIGIFWPEDNSSNPANALKTLLYRIRIMLAPLFGTELQPILSRRGAYVWNKTIECDVDVDRFESLCRQASNPLLGDEARMTLYREAVALYKGDFLPKLDGQLWVVPLSARYHALYLSAVKAFAGLLEAHEDFEEMAALCIRASELDSLDETLHVLILRALIRQGKNAAALTHYEKATDLLYRNLGVHPSQELRALYTEIMRVEKTLETDLGVIQENLQETAARPGAFVCEYGFFREVYRLETRRAQRSGVCVHIALITVALPGGGVPSLGVLNTTMDHLLGVLVKNLRRGDVISKYSGAQYVVMLPSANFEDSSMVMDRIVSTFYRQYRRNFLRLSCKIRELEVE